jgi:hypothetical protein
MRDTARAERMVEAGIITERDACTGKATFFHKNDARYAAKQIFRKTGRSASTYRCPFCGNWHVTKQRHGEDWE